MTERIDMRGALHAALIGMLVAGSIAMAGPGDVVAELTAPGVQTAVNVGDAMSFGGQVPPGSDVEAQLVAVGGGDVVLGTYNVSGRVTETAGQISGSVTVGCFYVPGCLDATTTAERDAAFDALAGYKLRLTVDSGSDTSPRLDFDDESPIITSYTLTAPTTVLVRFSEDVRDPDGDSALDWTVDGLRQVSSVTGTGNSRTLTFRMPATNDATPQVQYLPLASVDIRVPNHPYLDGARNALDADNRFARAADRIPPPVPTIARIDGDAVTYAAEDEAVAVLGSDTTPTVVIDDVPQNAVAQLYLDDGDGRFEADQDQVVGQATGDASGSVSIVLASALPDGVHRFYAQSMDQAACDPNTPSSATCPNVSGRSDEGLYDLETVPPTVGTVLGRGATIAVPFSETVTGTNAAGQWRVDNGAGNAVTVTGVSGSGARRTLQFSGGPLLTGSTLSWTQPASGAYADAHGNLLQTFTTPIVAAPLPLLDVVGNDGTEGNPSAIPPPSPPQVSYVVQLAEPLVLGESVTFDWTTVPGGDDDASASTDYTPASGTVTMNTAGQTESAPLPVRITRDALDEFNEDVFVRIENVVGATLPEDAATLVTAASIIDDDALALVSFADGSDAVTLDEGATTTLTVQLDVVSGKATSVAWRTVLDGDAEASDVPEQSGIARIAAGDTTASFDVRVNDDGEDEPNETFSVVLEEPVNADLDGARATTSVLTITDDDIPIPTLTVEGGQGPETAPTLPLFGRAQVPFTFRLSTATEQAIEVSWSTDTTGTALQDRDFDAASGSVRFEIGQTEKTVLINVIGDALDEFDETVALLVASPAGAEFDGGGASLTAFGEILDDDPPVQVALGDDVSISEGEAATFTVSTNALSGKDVTVSYSTSDGSAAAGSDYNAVSGEVTIAAGERSATFAVQSRDDAEVEGDEELTVEIALVTTEAATLGRATARLTILDNDVLVIGDPVLALTGAFVDEGNPPLINLGGPHTNATFELTLDAPADGAVSIDWTTTPDTAADGTDFVAGSGTATIANGARSTTVDVGVFSDVLDEFDEEFLFTVTGVTGKAQLPQGGLERTGTIVDDDPLATVAFASGSTNVEVTEGGSVQLTVALNTASGKPVDVAWSTDYDGTADTSDAPAQSGVVSIPAGSTSATLTISASNDEVEEPDETLSVLLSSPTNAALDGSRPIRARITIVDTIQIPTLSVATASTSEAPGALPPLTSPAPLSFTVTLDRAASVPVTVDFGTQSTGTATAESDFTAVGGTLTIDAGDTTAVIEVPVLNDGLDEFDETVVLRLTNIAGARFPGGVVLLDVEGMIFDDDPLAELRLFDAEVDEGEPATMSVSLDVPSGKDVEVAYETSDGSAAGGEDYLATSGTVIIPAGATTRTFTVQTRDDSDVEGDEDVNVSISIVRPDTATLVDGQAVLTILDNDVPLDGVPVVSLSSATVEEGDPATLPLPLTPNPVLEFQVRLSETVTGPVEISYATNAGTATAGADFESVTGTVTIPAGELTATVEVTVTPDLIDEFDEQLTLAITAVSSNAQLPANGLQRIGRILDDDPLASIAFADDSVDLGVAEGGSVELTVELVGETAKDVTFSWRTSFDSSATTDDAEAQQGSVTVLAGDTTARFVVTTLDDDLDEPSESFSVVLADPLNATLDRARTTTARISIVDDDLLASVLGITGGTVGEADGGPLAFLSPAQLVWELALDAPSEVDVTVDWATLDTGAAVAGSDYTGASGTVRIPAGETTAQLAVDVIDDAIDEFDEDVVMRLSNIRGGVLDGGASRLDEAGTITDDDPLAIASLGDEQTVDEGEPATFSVSLDTASGKTIVLRLRTLDGSARSGSDYTGIDREITIPAGQTTQTVTIQTIDDSLVEDDEDLQLQLSVVSDDAVALGRSTARMTITDNDLLPIDPNAVGISLTGASVDEGTPLLGGLVLPGTGSTLDFVVRLSRAAEEDIRLGFVTRPGTATAGSDYVARDGTVTVPAGTTELTIPVDVIPDDLDEDDEDLQLEIVSASGNGSLPAGGLARTGRILDDDLASALRIGDVGVIEGNDAVLDVSLNRASGRTIRVAWRIVEGTATAADVGATSGTLTFAAGVTRQTITLPTIADGITEGIEQLQVQLRSPVNATIEDAFGTVTIVDVGGPALVSVGDVSDDEGDIGQKTVRATVTLTSPSPTNTEVSWTSQRVTATPDEDYRAPGGSIVIPAGSTAGQISVTFLGDTEVEPDEDFLIVLSGSDAFIADPVGRVTIVTDDDAATDPGDGDGDGDGDGGDGGGSVGGDGDSLGAPGGGTNMPATGGGAAALAAALLGLGALIHRRRD